MDDRIKIDTQQIPAYTTTDGARFRYGIDAEDHQIWVDAGEITKHLIRYRGWYFVSTETEMRAVCIKELGSAVGLATTLIRSEPVWIQVATVASHGRIYDLNAETLKTMLDFLREKVT